MELVDIMLILLPFMIYFVYKQLTGKKVELADIIGIGLILLINLFAFAWTILIIVALIKLVFFM